MNKDEQKKIYSSYFPYKLEVLHVDTDWAEDRETTAILTGVFEDCLTFNQASDYYYKDDQIVIKPILYDLSYLTEDEFNFIWEDEIDFDSLEQFISLDWESRLTCRFSYSFWTELLKNHFNIFGLKESEYINKATLTNK